MIRNSAMARLGIMAFLTLCLLAPLAMVHATVSERAHRRDEAVQEVSSTWGAPQTIGGPILTVPYLLTWVDGNGKPQQAAHRLNLLPATLQITSHVAPDRRRRGIFDVVVYHATVEVSGRFVRPAIDSLKIPAEALDWDRATLSVGLSDPKGLTTRGTLTWNGTPTSFTAHVASSGLVSSGIQAPARGVGNVPENGSIPFSFRLQINGTHAIRFLPVAQEVTVDLASEWPHPSFTGAPLPQTRTTGETGFSAHWGVTDLGRAYPQQWTSQDLSQSDLASRADASAFGVILLQPVDIYQQAERAVKYAILFIVLTFLVFFLWEVFQATLLHPVQYLLVGSALCLFYLLLVSLSEHIGFDTAYVISATAATLLIGGYSRAVLKGTRQAGSVVLSLAALYGFLYLLLRLEDYALVAGSVGMFLILAFVMFITRRMDWYNLRLGAAE